MEFDYTATTASTPQVSAPPLSIKEIADKATQIDFNILIPLKYWLRTAENLRKEVKSSPAPHSLPYPQDLHSLAGSLQICNRPISTSQKGTINMHTCYLYDGWSEFP
jgi:hypothetical protein